MLGMKLLILAMPQICLHGCWKFWTLYSCPWVWGLHLTLLLLFLPHPGKWANFLYLMRSRLKSMSLCLVSGGTPLCHYLFKFSDKKRKRQSGCFLHNENENAENPPSAGSLGRKCLMEAGMLSPLNLHAVIHPRNNCRALTCYGPLFFTGDHQEKAPWTVVRAQWRTVHVLPSEALNTSALLPCSWGVWSGQGLVDIPDRVRWIHLAKKRFSAQRLWGPGVLAYGNKNRLSLSV